MKGRGGGVMRQRAVAVEALDHLPVDHPAALRSRRDLRRIHYCMGSRPVLLRALRTAMPRPSAGRPLRMLELGAGDGTLLLGVARHLAPHWPHVDLTLLDRQPLLVPQTTRAFARLGWTVRQQHADVFDWAAPWHALSHATDAAAAERAPAPWDLIVTSLFLHHFADAALAGLLRAIAAATPAFVALEPRRAPLAWAGSRLVGLIGANAVTREDSVLSVRAGFRGQELSALWPPACGWQLREHPAHLFSHCLVAVRAPAAQG